MTRRWFPASTVALALFGALASAQIPNADRGSSSAAVLSSEFLQQFERGLSSLERGEAKTALSLFTRLREQAPQHSWTRLAEASCLLQLRDFEAAARAFEALTGDDDPPAAAFAGLGAVLLNQGRPREAIRQLELAARSSRSPSPRFMLACALCLAGEPERAAAECEEAERRLVNGPHSSLADEIRGLAALLKGEYQVAIASFRRALAEPVAVGLTALPAATAILRPAEQDAVGRRAETAAIGRRDETGNGSIVRSDREAISRAGTSFALAVRRKDADPGDEATRPARPSLRGVVPIVLTIPEADRVRQVVFVIDGKQKARILIPPYRWDWDTTQDAEGDHRLVVQAYDDGGRVIHTAVRTLEIRNAEPAAEAGTGAPEANAVVRRISPAPAPPPPSPFEASYGPRLERLLEFQTDTQRVRYLLAQAYEGEGQREFAAEELGSLFLEQPDYLEVRKRFLALRAQVQPSYRPEAVPEVRGVNRADRVVALTFDDGPRPPYTERILEILRARKLKATFFLVGKMVDIYPQFARELAAEGHELGNHSYSHENMARLSLIECEQEVLRCERSVGYATGARLALFRPPGGHYGPELKQALGHLGYSTVFWTSNITSWAERPPEEIALRMADKVASGGILLLHNGQDQTVFVLPKLLDLLQARGFRCVTVSQLLTRGAPGS